MGLALFAFILLISSFVISTILTKIVSRISVSKDFVARPQMDRFHQKIIPLGGGIAIFWTIAFFLLAGALSVKFLIVPGHLWFLDESVTEHTEGFLGKINDMLLVLLCALVLHILGLFDDKKRLGPVFKLAVQLAVAFIAVFCADIRVELFIQSKLVTSLLSAFWIVFIINAFNFLDNMDGLSAGIAVIVSLILFTAAASSGQVFVGSLALVFSGTLMGFLLFNFPPAKIFMGDAGSLVIGFFLAVLTLRTTYYHETQGGAFYAVFMPLVVMAVPLYDFISVTFLRISHGKSPFVGDTQHFSHRLKRRGLTDTQTALTLYLATLCSGLGAVLLSKVDTLGAVLVFTQTLIVLIIIAILEAAGASSDNSS